MKPSAPWWVVIVVISLTAQAENREGKARATLPPGGKYAEVLLTSSWFSIDEMIGPIGGPTQGYDLALEAWPNGPTLVLAGRIGKDNLGSDPDFVTLGKPTLKLAPESDGHAVAYTSDGKAWHAAYLDGPTFFFCPHELVKPGSIPPTRALVERVLTGAGHPLLPDMTPIRGSISSNPVEELRGALAYAFRRGGDPKLAELGKAWLADLGHAEVIGRYRLSAETEEPDAPPPVVARPSAPPPPPCPMVHPDTRPLPKELTQSLILSRLGFPDRIDQKTCASWGELQARVKEYVTAGRQPPLGPAPPAVGPTLGGSMCASILMAVAQQRFQRPGGGQWAASQAVLDSYEAEFARCGHADERDEKCERALLRTKELEWIAAMEAARLAECRGQQELVSQARTCLESGRGRGDPAALSEAAQVWNIISGLPTVSENLFCPPKPPKWPTPMPRRRR